MRAFRNTYYLDGILSYAYNKYDASRHIAFGNIDRVAKSDYAGHQYSAYVEGGYNFKKQGWNISPLVSLQYARLHLNKYSESDANSVNLDVDAQNYDMLQSGVGARFSYPLLYERSQIIPEVHVRWFYDFIGDRQQATATFTGAVLILHGRIQPAEIELQCRGKDHTGKQERHHGFAELRLRSEKRFLQSRGLCKYSYHVLKPDGCFS